MSASNLRWVMVLALAMAAAPMTASAQDAEEAEQADEAPADPAPAPDEEEIEATPPADADPPPVSEAPPEPVRPPPARVASPPPSSTTTTTHRHTATETGRVSTGAVPGGRAASNVPAEPEEEEEEGDGRDVDFIWFEIEGGISNVNLIAFRDANFASVATGEEAAFEELSGTGPFAGLGVGFRVFILAVGARFTYANYQNFDIGNLGGDVTIRLPIPIVEPYARVGFGYAWQGQANYSNPSMSTTTVFGWSFDSALGLDIYLANWFTIGAGVGLNVLNMGRQRDPSQPCMGATDICPDEPGDAVGYQLRGFGQIGFRF